MTLALIIINTAYLIFLVGFLVFSGIALFHLSEYGYIGDFSRTMMIIYSTIAGIIMVASVVAMLFLR